jgi:ATP-dependent Lhr-like helicase
VAGLNREQFALPEAIDFVRALRRMEPKNNYLRVSAFDPLNPAKILTSGPRIAAVSSGQ